MRQFKGLPASNGIAIGPAHIYHPQVIEVVEKKITDAEEEWLRYQNAMATAKTQLQALEEKAKNEIGAEEAAIFQAHQEFLADVELINSVKEDIFTFKINAEAAVSKEFGKFADLLSKLEDPYLRARAQDIKDVCDRLVRCLQGNGIDLIEGLPQPVIIVAEDLTPSDTVQFEKNKLLGICISKGGPTSHTAILARSLGIPAVVSAPFCFDDVENGILTILDGIDGTVSFGPTLNELNLAKERKAAYEKTRDEQISLSSQPAITRDGHQVEVVANIGGAEDAQNAMQMGAEGVGLFRTEFLYLDRSDLIPLEDQVTIYRSVFKVLDGKPIVIRTLDIGGDKSLSYLSLQAEQNPFLGWRGIRMVRERPDILENQFRALLLASPGADLRIMLPMVSGVGEVERSREIFDAVREDLLKKKVPISDRVQFGIMIEVPSAALLATHLAKLVDFFSIGTNDLTQYTIAVDRTNERVAVLASPYNPAVLKLIHMTIEAAHSEGKWVGLCGELAGDVPAVPLLLGMGLDEFSMAPGNVPPVKEAIRKWSLDKARVIASEALKMRHSTDVLAYLKKQEPA
jgi:phosphoenolpyruvate-protein phosphotransferase